jgi:N-carbamoylputrescine amidase
VRDAARLGAAVVCLPELFQAQYFCQREDIRLFDLAEPIPGPTTEKLGAVAREEKVVVIASLFERRAPGLYHNTAAILEKDGRIAGLYRKMHIPDDPLYYEKFYFTPGDLGFRAFDTSAWAGRNAGVLGSVVSGRRRGSPRCRARMSVLSDCDRLAPAGKGRVWSGAIRRVADHPAGARHCQRRVCGGGESCRRGARRCARESRRRAGTGVLGRIVSGRSVWAGDRKASHDREEILIGEIDLRRWKIRAATGRSCATGASMRMGPIVIFVVWGTLPLSGWRFFVGKRKFARLSEQYSQSNEVDTAGPLWSTLYVLDAPPTDLAGGR